MAKTVSGPTDEVWNEVAGKYVPTGFTSGKVTRAARRSSTREIEWTPGPQTRGQRIARALWG